MQSSTCTDTRRACGSVARFEYFTRSAKTVVSKWWLGMVQYDLKYECSLHDMSPAGSSLDWCDQTLETRWLCLLHLQRPRPCIEQKRASSWDHGRIVWQEDRHLQRSRRLYAYVLQKAWPCKLHSPLLTCYSHHPSFLGVKKGDYMQQLFYLPYYRSQAYYLCWSMLFCSLSRTTCWWKYPLQYFLNVVKNRSGHPLVHFDLHLRMCKNRCEGDTDVVLNALVAASWRLREYSSWSDLLVDSCQIFPLMAP